MNTVCCFDKISEKIKQMLGRDTKYQKVVAKARQIAKEDGENIIVYQQGNSSSILFINCYFKKEPANKFTQR